MNDMTQTAFVMADAAGKITQRMSMPRWMAEHQTPPEGGCLVFADGDLDADYVKEGAVVPRPANPATLSGMTLENLPVPCTVTVKGTSARGGEHRRALVQPSGNLPGHRVGLADARRHV